MEGFSTAKRPKVICDLTFLVYCASSVRSIKNIIELRNTENKTDSEDTTPGILIFSKVLYIFFKSNSLLKKQGHI